MEGCAYYEGSVGLRSWKLRNVLLMLHLQLIGRKNSSRNDGSLRDNREATPSGSSREAREDAACDRCSVQVQLHQARRNRMFYPGTAL